MKNHNQNVGARGEEIAALYLKRNGYSVLSRHFTTHWGEIDIVAKKGIIVAFIEVKTRVGFSHGEPYEAISYYKVRSLKRAVLYYLEKHSFKSYSYSLDVVSIVLQSDLSVRSLRHFKSITL